MLYNYPGRTGVDMSPEFIAGLTALEHVQYIKESTGEMARMTTLMRLCGERLGVFCGCDTIALESFMVGAIGWVGGVANVLPASHARLYELSVVKKDYVSARKLFFEMLPTLELMEGGGKYTQWVKAACAILGRDVGIPRQPLGAATKAECGPLRQALRLRLSDRPVAVIARECGFETLSHFNRQFALRHGASPRELRRQKAPAPKG